MLSIYTSAFNVNKMEYDWQAALTNFLQIADEVVVAVNTSEDDTKDAITAFKEPQMPIRIIETEFGYDDPDLDGRVKNAALQDTIHPYKLGLDLDERISPRFKGRLINLTAYFLHDQTDCIML